MSQDYSLNSTLQPVSWMLTGNNADMTHMLLQVTSKFGSRAKLDAITGQKSAAANDKSHTGATATLRNSTTL